MDTSLVWTVLGSAMGQATQEAAKSAITGADLRIVAACASAAFAVAIGVFAAGLSEGIAAGKACEGIARNPEASGPITRTLIIGQAITEATAIYAFVVALFILILAGR